MGILHLLAGTVMPSVVISSKVLVRSGIPDVAIPRNSPVFMGVGSMERVSHPLVACHLDLDR
jgi:hypothetical protein